MALKKEIMHSYTICGAMEPGVSALWALRRDLPTGEKHIQRAQLRTCRREKLPANMNTQTIGGSVKEVKGMTLIPKDQMAMIFPTPVLQLTKEETTQLGIYAMKEMNPYESRLK